MKQLILAAALALAATMTHAQTITDSGGTILPGSYDKSGATKAAQYCQIAVTPTATSLASLLASGGCASIRGWATLAFVTPEASTTVAIRYRADGTAPTASTGQPIAGYQSWPMQGLPTLEGASVISATGSNVIVDVEIRG